MTSKPAQREDLELIGNKMSSLAQTINDVYPALIKFNIVQRLIAESDKWERKFSSLYSKERSV